MKKIVTTVAKAGAVLVLATPTALMTTSASAAPVATGKATAKPSVSVNSVKPLVGSCLYQAAAPQQPVFHSTVYGSGQINSCAGDVEECHLTVDLQKMEPQGYYVTVGHKDGGWTTCNGKVLKPPYGCPGGYDTSTFISLATLVVSGSGGPGAPDAVYSGSAKLACT